MKRDNGAGCVARYAVTDGAKIEIINVYIDYKQDKEAYKMGGGYVKKKPYWKMIIMGAISISLYALLLLKGDVIVNYCAKGGVYAVLPIIAAFIFSYFHGGFTGSFWSVLGVEAKKIKGVK